MESLSPEVCKRLSLSHADFDFFSYRFSHVLWLPLPDDSSAGSFFCVCFCAGFADWTHIKLFYSRLKMLCANIFRFSFFLYFDNGSNSRCWANISLVSIAECVHQSFTIETRDERCNKFPFSFKLPNCEEMMANKKRTKTLVAFAEQEEFWHRKLQTHDRNGVNEGLEGLIERHREEAAWINWLTNLADDMRA